MRNSEVRGQATLAAGVPKVSLILRRRRGPALRRSSIWRPALQVHLPTSRAPRPSLPRSIHRYTALRSTRRVDATSLGVKSTGKDSLCVSHLWHKEILLTALGVPPLRSYPCPRVVVSKGVATVAPDVPASTGMCSFPLSAPPSIQLGTAFGTRPQLISAHLSEPKARLHALPRLTSAPSTDLQTGG